MGIITHSYLSDAMLQGLAAYQYKAGGYTWLDDLHNPFWNWTVEHVFPLWLAPNLVTLIGTLFMLGAHALLWAYVPSLDGKDAPRWVHLMAGLALFAYVNLDCMDGKQARRTGTSSPLGQLFDHGCDALVVGIILVNVAASGTMTIRPDTVALMFSSMITWILAQWQEYHTGVMLYGNGYFGVLEANYALGMIHLISAAFGGVVWHRPLGSIIGNLPAWLVDVELLHALFALALLAMSLQICSQVWGGFSGAGKLTEAEAGRKSVGKLAALQHLLYFVLFFALAYMFMLQPRQAGKFHSRMLATYVTVSYSTIATQLIMAHMAKERFRPTVVPYLGLVVGAANSHLHFLPAPALYALTAFIVVLYLHYVVNVCRQVCNYLDISCLTIKPKAL